MVITVMPAVSLIDLMSDTRPQKCTDLQSPVKCQLFIALEARLCKCAIQSQQVLLFLLPCSLGNHWNVPLRNSGQGTAYFGKEPKSWCGHVHACTGMCNPHGAAAEQSQSFSGLGKKPPRLC